MKQTLYQLAGVLCICVFAITAREVVHQAYDFGIVRYTCPDCGAPNNSSEADALWWTCYRCHRHHLPYVGRE